LKIRNYEDIKMSNYEAIADVGETLVNLLWNNMQDLTPSIPSINSIVLASPGEIDPGTGTNEIVLSLFLYQILENPYLKNQEMQKMDSSTLTFPPIALDLYYMLTSYPFGAQEVTERTKGEHKILGKALQILNDNSILAGSVLEKNLAENNNELHITLIPLSLDEMTRMWTAFPGKPFRSSICFLVTPVFIESTRPELNVQRVVSKEADYNIMVPKKEVNI
jgi:hypothetical protein